MKFRIFVTSILTVAALAIAGAAFAQDKALIDKGMKVYAANKMCAACHSIAGKGNVKGALDDVGNKLTADQIRAWLVTPKEMTTKMKATRQPPMPVTANLAKDDLDALVAYMGSLKKK